MEKLNKRLPINRVKKYFEYMGFHIAACEGDLKEVFDIQTSSVFPEARDPRLIKVQVDYISRTVEKAVRGFETHMGKEIWLIRYGEKKTHPGQAHIYRFSGSKLIKESKDLPLNDALRKAVKSAESVSKLRKKG